MPFVRPLCPCIRKGIRCLLQSLHIGLAPLPSCLYSHDLVLRLFSSHQTQTVVRGGGRELEQQQQNERSPVFCDSTVFLVLQSIMGKEKAKPETTNIEKSKTGLDFLVYGRRTPDAAGLQRNVLYVGAAIKF